MATQITEPNRRVLFVDDEAFILEAMERQVGDEFDVQTASSGSNALSVLKGGAQFAVIVADMRMPIMNGVEFLVKAREIDSKFVAIMLTGNTDRQTAIDAVEKGQVFHFLTKPCNRDRLLKAVEAATQLYALHGQIDQITSFLKDVA